MPRLGQIPTYTTPIEDYGYKRSAIAQGIASAGSQIAGKFEEINKQRKINEAKIASMQESVSIPDLINEKREGEYLEKVRKFEDAISKVKPGLFGGYSDGDVLAVKKMYSNFLKEVQKTQQEDKMFLQQFNKFNPEVHDYQEFQDAVEAYTKDGVFMRDDNGMKNILSYKASDPIAVIGEYMKNPKIRGRQITPIIGNQRVTSEMWDEKSGIKDLASLQRGTYENLYIGRPDFAKGIKNEFNGDAVSPEERNAIMSGIKQQNPHMNDRQIENEAARLWGSNRYSNEFYKTREIDRKEIKESAEDKKNVISPIEENGVATWNFRNKPISLKGSVKYIEGGQQKTGQLRNAYIGQLKFGKIPDTNDTGYYYVAQTPDDEETQQKYAAAKAQGRDLSTEEKLNIMFSGKIKEIYIKKDDISKNESEKYIFKGLDKYNSAPTNKWDTYKRQ